MGYWLERMLCVDVQTDLALLPLTQQPEMNLTNSSCAAAAELCSVNTLAIKHQALKICITEKLW